MKILRKIEKYFIKIFKKKNIDNRWLSYYSEKDKSIKFTNKTIYQYLKDEVGNDLDFYALNYFNTRITYKEMFSKINLLSRSLCYLGVKKGDIVTICMPNTPSAVEMFYAINKIGAVADMIHPLSSKTEIKEYLTQSKSRILMLYDANYEKVKDIIDETNIYKVILVSASESMPTMLSIGYNLTKGLRIKKPAMWDTTFISFQELLNMGHLFHGKTERSMGAKDMAVILHSGGTTGIPKGICLSNANFNAEAQQGAINVKNVRPQDKIMTILPIFHGFGLGVCTHCPLCLKVEVILIPEFDNRRFHRTMEKYKPNVLAGVPTLFEAMLTNERFKNIDLSSLKYLISGGDKLSVEMENDMNKFLSTHNANIIISKGYGMTESVAATAYTFDGTNEPGSIGIPMIGNRFKICKPDSIEELPASTEGEIVVFGPTVMMGYLNNQKETDKVLKTHKDGKVWLHTGDAGYIDEKGIIYFTHRLKRMIVSSGFNIYPNIIEDVIGKHPKVDRVCVVGIPHKYKMSVAKAFVVLKDGVKQSAKIKAEIRLLCKENLAAFSQPKEFEFISSMPLTLYKKIDYKYLEEMEKKKYEEREQG